METTAPGDPTSPELVQRAPAQHSVHSVPPRCSPLGSTDQVPAGRRRGREREEKMGRGEGGGGRKGEGTRKKRKVWRDRDALNIGFSSTEFWQNGCTCMRKAMWDSSLYPSSDLRTALSMARYSV